VPASSAGDSLPAARPPSIESWSSASGDRAALQALEDEVIDRLYVLNAERAREEERLGTGAKGKRAALADESEEVKSKPSRKKVQKKAGAGEPERGAPQGRLF